MTRAIVLALALALLGQPALAQTALDADIKCLAASIYLGSASDAQTRTVATMNALYFMGRIEAQTLSAAELQARLLAASKAMTVPERRPTLTACAISLRDAGRKLRTLGENIQGGEVQRP